MKPKPALLLLPNLLGDHPHHGVFLPASVDRAVQSLDGLICESQTEGRRYLSRFETMRKPHEIPIALYNDHTKDDELDFLLEPIRKGERWGLISDCGLPCIADPGYKLVRRARIQGINIQAFIGPSAVTLALMLSGLPAQKFFFHGYLDKEEQPRQQKITLLEKQSKQENATQIFIEAPHRNKHMLESLLGQLPDSTWLCVAWDLTLPTQGIVTQQIHLWKKNPLPNVEKKPTIFLIHSE